ncbi:MAG TPA: hypothetical protein VFE50_06095 [Cyclobacteriaceae bacterium]|nr:hypothetical protein [Cyclobacteriaceae bacterium]
MAPVCLVIACSRATNEATKEATGDSMAVTTEKARIFSINDDYGFMSFYFDGEGTCIYVSYEERE